MNKILLLVALFACATYASICHSWGDPHNRLLNGKTYDLYKTQGDFVFFEYDNILIQERVSNSKTWGTNSLLIGAAVKIGSKTFEILNDVVRINKKISTIAQVRAAGVQVTGNVFTITSQGITIKIHNHAASDAISGKNYLSLYVDVPAALQKNSNRFRGLCVANDSSRFAVRNFRRSLFATKPNYVTLPPAPRRIFTRAQVRAAQRACRRTGLKARASLKNCVYDYLRAANKAAVLRAYAGDRKDNVALRKIDKKNNKKLLKRRGGCRRAVRRCRRVVRKLKTRLAQVTTIRGLTAQNFHLRRHATNLNNKVRAAENRIRSLSSSLNDALKRFNAAESARLRAEAELKVLKTPNPRNNWECRYYLARYRDLRNAFGSDCNRARQHWDNHGFNEKRVGNAQFDCKSYLARYADLRNAYGNNCNLATAHWFNHGIAEGRNANKM